MSFAEGTVPGNPMSPLLLASTAGLIAFIALEGAVFSATWYILRKKREVQTSQTADWRDALARIDDLRHQVSQMVTTVEGTFRGFEERVVKSLSRQYLDAIEGKSPTPQVDAPATLDKDIPLETPQVDAPATLDKDTAVAVNADSASPTRLIRIYSAISAGGAQELKEIGHLQGLWTDPGSFTVVQVRIADTFDRNVVIEIGRRLRLCEDIHQKLAAERTNADSLLLDLTCAFSIDPLPIVQPPRLGDQQTFDITLVPKLDRVLSHTSVAIHYIGKLAQLKIDVRD